MSPTLKLMGKVAELSSRLKACKCAKERGRIMHEIERTKCQIDVLIDQRNEELRKKNEAKYGPSTNTYSDATVEFEDRMGYRYN